MQCSVSWKGATFYHIWEGARGRLKVWAADCTHNMGCSTAARLHTHPHIARNSTVCFSHTQHFDMHMSAHKHKIEQHTSQARHPRTSGPTKLAPVTRCTGRADHSCALLKRPRPKHLYVVRLASWLVLHFVTPAFHGLHTNCGNSHAVQQLVKPMTESSMR